MKAIRYGIIPLLVFAFWPQSAAAQWTAEKPGSDNLEVVGHIPLGTKLSVSDIELEQELDRPYAYVGRMSLGPMVYDGEEAGPKGMDIISLADPAHPKVLYQWRIDNEDLHLPLGGMDIKYFKWNDRYYVVQSLQFFGGPDADLGAVVLDVTGLPDPSTVKEAVRIRSDRPGGFHNIFVYKHSNGRVLLFATTQGPSAYVYDLGLAVEGDLDNAFVGEVPIPDNIPGRPDYTGYHDFYVGYHVESGQDRFYGGGAGGYYVYNVTDVKNPDIVVTLTNIPALTWGHTFTPSPDGRYAVAETEHQYSPLRIFDMKRALDGEVTNISQPISAWTADWKNLTHNHEVRWPYVFVSGYLDGLQIFSLMDPHTPVTVAYYDTYLGPPNPGSMAMFNGAFGVDVRNEDGLIVVSDMTTGLWVFRMDGFQGWNGADWGVPNISSVQNWDEGPQAGTH